MLVRTRRDFTSLEGNNTPLASGPGRASVASSTWQNISLLPRMGSKQMVRVFQSCLQVLLIHTPVLSSLKHWQFAVVEFNVSIQMNILNLNSSKFIQNGDHTNVLFSTPTSTNQLIKVSLVNSRDFRWPGLSRGLCVDPQRGQKRTCHRKGPLLWQWLQGPYQWVPNWRNSMGHDSTIIGDHTNWI